MPETISAFRNSREIIITEAGGPAVLQLRTSATIAPGPGEILVAVAAAGVNRHDCNQRWRGPVSKCDCPTNHGDVPGLEVAGLVAAVGPGVTGWAAGDRVAALVDGAGYADFVRARAADALPVPDSLPLEEAAAFPEALFTTWYNVFDIAVLGPGESALLHGGTSGVGVVAIQLLSALGHPVFATCGSVEKMQLARTLGTVAAFNYREEGFENGVLAETSGRGVDVILDMSGGRHSAENIRMLARRGRLIHLSPGAGAEFRVPIRAIMAKEARISGSLLRPLAASEKARIAERIRAVAWPLVAGGRVRPVIHKVFDLSDAAAAHAEMERGAHAGKILLACAGAASFATAGSA